MIAFRMPIWHTDRESSRVSSLVRTRFVAGHSSGETCCRETERDGAVASPVASRVGSIGRQPGQWLRYPSGRARHVC